MLHKKEKNSLVDNHLKYFAKCSWPDQPYIGIRIFKISKNDCKKKKHKKYDMPLRAGLFRPLYILHKRVRFFFDPQNRFKMG